MIKRPKPERFRLRRTMMFNPTLHPIAFVLIIVCIVLLVSPVFMSKKKAAK